MQIKSVSPEETREVGAKLTKKTSRGDVYALTGSLGSGKTELVRGYVAAPSADAPVCSPSFTIVNTYHTDTFTIHHFDFYRIKNPDELIEIGFHEYIHNDAVCFIEWADMFPMVIPDKARFIRFKVGKNNIRFISIDE